MLVVDALNYLGRFVPCDEFPHWTPTQLFAEARARVAEFAKALKAASIEAVFVFDNGQATDEANTKWLERRRKEVETGTRNMPANAEVLLMAMLEDAGFLVLFPAGIDGDDAVARLAMKFNGVVLSRDQDMMRYGLASGRVLKDFAIRQNRLEFLERNNSTSASQRDVSSIPCADVNDWKAKGSTLHVNAMTGIVRRGNADGQTRRLGNLHAIARPLRAALYARFGIDVTESLPAWRNGAFVMETTVVHPDTTHDEMLNDAHAMLAWIRINDDSDDSRIHASAMIAAEICDAATPPDGLTSCQRIVHIYETLNATAPTPAKPTKDWCAGGRCAGLRGQTCIGDGLCFPMEIEGALYRNKDPLCNKCLTRLLNMLESRKQGRRF